MQQNYPKKGIYQQLQEPARIELTYENLIREMHKLFYGTEIPEEELKQMVDKHNRDKDLQKQG